MSFTVYNSTMQAYNLLKLYEALTLRAGTERGNRHKGFSAIQN